MLRRTLLAGLTATATQTAASAVTPNYVDVLLVLAMDASGSLSDERLTMQREGHARAIEGAEFVEAVRNGLVGRVALAAVEWSSQDRQDLTVPWTIVQDASTARDFADALRRAPRPIPGFTSISGALDYSARLLAGAPYGATRHVVDISGNGRSNDGRPAAEARDDALGAGIVINGLPILDADPDLHTHYASEVIGGPRSFMEIAHNVESFGPAVLRKLVIEVVGGARKRGAA